MRPQRRSTSVTLTILPLLATAAAASADSLPGEPAATTDPVSAPGMTPPLDPDGIPAPDPSRPFGPQDMRLSPPGMTPTVDELDCDDPSMPYWEYRVVCEERLEEEEVGIVRGGFGHYFWAGGG